MLVADGQPVPGSSWSEVDMWKLIKGIESEKKEGVRMNGHVSIMDRHDLEVHFQLLCKHLIFCGDLPHEWVAGRIMGMKSEEEDGAERLVEFWADFLLRLSNEVRIAGAGAISRNPAFNRGCPKGEPGPIGPGPDGEVGVVRQIREALVKDLSISAELPPVTDGAPRKIVVDYWMVHQAVAILKCYEEQLTKQAADAAFMTEEQYKEMLGLKSKLAAYKTGKLRDASAGHSWVKVKTNDRKLLELVSEAISGEIDRRQGGQGKGFEFELSLEHGQQAQP